MYIGACLVIRAVNFCDCPYKVNFCVSFLQNRNVVLPQEIISNFNFRSLDSYTHAYSSKSIRSTT